MNHRAFSHSLLSSVFCVAVLVLALPASAGNQVPFELDTALVSIPAPTHAGCPGNTIRMNVTGPAKPAIRATSQWRNSCA